MRDPLAGLANRRFLDENLEPLVHSSLHASSPLSCIAIDMDNFKLVNDTLGHKAGDELLTFLASLIRANARNQDFAIRLGGDEFLLILPGCRIQRASQLAHTIALLFRQNARTVHTADIPVDLSFGVACLGPDITSAKQLLERADANLYAAKRSGKGRIVTG
jgi:diguanylate cyclase (GGDEF)-like protein